MEVVVQRVAQKTSQAQEVFQDGDASAISSCANSMRLACDGLRVRDQAHPSSSYLTAAAQSKLPAENRQALSRIEVGLATVMQGLEVCVFYAIWDVAILLVVD